jgi:hypothetical protein
MDLLTLQFCLPVTSSLSDQNIFLSILLSSACNICTSVMMRHPVFTHIQNIRLKLYLVCFNYYSWGNSVSIEPDYRLDDRSSIPGRGKGYLL